MRIKLKITKPGTQTRNFTHINDTINALELIAEKGNGDEYGIAHPDKHSIENIAQLISDDYEYVEGNMANRMNSTVMTDKITELGWKAENNLSDYIKSQL